MECFKNNILQIWPLTTTKQCPKDEQSISSKSCTFYKIYKKSFNF